MDIKYAYMIIGIVATVAVVTVVTASSQHSLDSILANKDCKALEKYGQTEIYDTNVTPEQSKKILEVSTYCAGKVLENMYGDDSGTTKVSESKPAVAPINKKLQALQKMISTDEEIIALQKKVDKLPTLSEMADNSGLDKSQARADYDNLTNGNIETNSYDFKKCIKSPYDYNEITILACYYNEEFTKYGTIDQYHNAIKKLNASAPKSIFDIGSSKFDEYTEKKAAEMYAMITQFDKYAKLAREWTEIQNNVFVKVADWESERKFEIIETFYDKAEAIDKPTIRTEFKNEIENCDSKYWLYDYDAKIVKDTELFTCLVNASEKYANDD